MTFSDDFLQSASPDDIRNIIMEQGQAIEALRQSVIELQEVGNAAKEIGDLDFRAFDGTGVARMIMSGKDLYDEIKVHAFLAALSQYGYPTAWMDADTGDSVAAGGNALMSDRGFIAGGIPIIFEEVTQRLVHIIFMAGYSDPEWGTGTAKTYNILFDKNSLGTDLISGGDFENDWADYWDDMPIEWNMVEHENGEAIEIVDGFLTQVISVDEDDLYLVEVDVFGDVNITVNADNLGSTQNLIVYQNSFSAWTKINLLFIGEAPGLIGGNITLKLSRSLTPDGSGYEAGNGYFDNVKIRKINNPVGHVYNLGGQRIYTFGDLYDKDGNVIVGGSSGGSGGFAIYGDGVNGSATLDAATPYSWASLAGSTYTLLQDIYLADLTVMSGVTLITAGYRIFCSGTLTNDGTIHNNGSNASGATGGAGGAAGYYLGGVAGGNGVASGAAAAAGSDSTTTTSDHLAGGIAGRGAPGWASGSTYKGGSPSSNTIYTQLQHGGRNLIRNIVIFIQKAFYTTAMNRFVPSFGGGGGGKSATGTSCESGGGGGGGGCVALLAKTLINNGTISANGGNGGNATGTGANAGGGGGGGGGIIWIVSNTYTNSGAVQANKGVGGTSIAGGTTPTKAVAESVTVTQGSSMQTISLTSSTKPQKNTLYLVATHVQGLLTPTVTGWGLTWNLINTVDFNSIASPTRRLCLFAAYGSPSVDQSNIALQVSYPSAPTSHTAILYQIQNATGTIVQNSTNRVDSATSLTVTLGSAFGSTNAAAFGVFARSGGTGGTAGSGFVLIGSVTGAPIMLGEIGYNDTTVDMSHTTAAAIAGIAIEIQAISAMEHGQDGYDGEVVLLQN